MGIKSVIIEDEPMGIKNLEALLQMNHPEIEVIKVATTIPQAREALQLEEADLFFVDINLRDGSIFDVLNELSPEQQKPVVFITAYEQYGAKAFQYPALHYILKPVNPEELKKAVSRYYDLKKPAQQHQESNSVSLTMQFDKILLPTQNGHLFLDPKQIIRVQSVNKYSIVFTDDKKQYIISRPLVRFEEILGSKGFLRIHDSHLINISCIKSYLKGKTGELIMSDDTTVPVAPKRKDILHDIFKNKV